MKVKRRFDQGYSKMEFTYNNKPYTIRIKGDNRRAKSCHLLLEKYPNYLSIHDKILTDLYDDPNKAVNEFIHDEGFSPFIDEKEVDSGKKRKILSYKIKIPELCKFLDVGGELKPNNRQGLTKNYKNKLIKKCSNRCMITGYKLSYKKNLDEKSHKFMNKLLIMNFDHRTPLFKGGDNSCDDLNNWMLLSEYVNQEKNKICKTCAENNCQGCGLAFPEKSHIIKPSKQNLKEIFVMK